MIEADPIWKTRPLDVCMIQHGWYKASDPMKRYLKKMFPKQYYLDSQGKDKLADSNGGENGTGNGPDDAKSVHSAHKSQVSGIAKSEASYAAQRAIFLDFCFLFSISQLNFRLVVLIDVRQFFENKQLVQFEFFHQMNFHVII